MKLLFLHGWGLDGSLWDGARAALPEFETVAMDRGYFGSPITEKAAGAFVAVGHSLGALLLADMPGASGLVAINGFDRFAGDGAVAPRIVDRMRRRFAEAPAEVLSDFRARIAAPSAPERIDRERLRADLDLLAEADARGTARPRTLVLHGDSDPLLPAPMRETVFAGAPRETMAGGGHLLPMTHPAWVADHIRAFAA